MQFFLDINKNMYTISALNQIIIIFLLFFLVKRSFMQVNKTETY